MNALDQRVRRSGTSFYWAMRLLPRERRMAMFALYACCRTLDDIADGDAPAAEKRARLAGFRTAIGALASGQRPIEPDVAALAPAFTRFHLPQAELEAIVDGMAMDVDGPLIAPPLATLHLYCRRVAGAVGLLAVHVFERPDAGAFALALGEALQMTNILRDIAEDAAEGRLYLPAELLSEVGIRTRIPAAVLADPALPLACEAFATGAEARFAAAAAELPRIGRHGLWPALAMGATYRRQLHCLRAHGWRSWPAPRPGRLAKAWFALTAVASG
ncbi:MAG: squalene/phytoene synthase family protein [Magnetospirillum sp.]|nr:squalene/phytoene synthase family protein [Magnetospirillum sp.]